ncbi:16S rRNA (guanine(966)-N(2))-methyltransferase RsmD [Marinobacterium aestuariivivens]|uniref:Ribosomal RNA small subunit methyltransferase D n=1 Tax=Marinobacterium aestuariivivens TaxID=1698799 RepID=A0ABW1ZZ01_9GAMM
MGRHNHKSRGQTRAPAPGDGELRIIAGEWRGRKLNFPELPGLRPTPDRVRETLFNWLQSYLPGARCLDLFAGSGALGLEALSRGAASATFVDNAPQVVQRLRENLQRLKADNAEVIQAPAMDWLNARQTDLEPRYDLVFLDPPFRCDLLPLACELIESRNLLADQALIYIEAETELGLPRLPENWHELRSKTAGQVSYRLFVREPEAARDA